MSEPSAATERRDVMRARIVQSRGHSVFGNTIQGDISKWLYVMRVTLRLPGLRLFIGETLDCESWPPSTVEGLSSTVLAGYWLFLQKVDNTVYMEGTPRYGFG